MTSTLAIEDLLKPIPGPNPGGQNLRYDSIYDKVKEARREEDDAPQGEWQREIKKADYALVIRLATDGLATKSKDLHLAAWLTEALLRSEGLSGLEKGLNLLRGLAENFWDTLYPELEEGDAELRAVPLEWVGLQLEPHVKRILLTRPGKIDWFGYRESRSVGYEADAASNETKQKVREAAVADGKVTAEQFDEAFDSTPKAFYEELMRGFEGSLNALRSLEETCNQKFGDSGPSFGRLRTVLEEVKQTAKVFLEKKRQQEPDAQQLDVSETTEAGEAPESPGASSGTVQREALASAARLRPEEPADREDAIRRLVALATYLRQQDASSPVPYLMLRALRWGELRSAGSSLDAALLEAPSTEIRQQLRKLALDGESQQVLELAETTMGQPCGRGWLDLQRYVVKACEALGSYDSVAVAVRSELRSLLVDYPELPQLSLSDDTPTANAETQTWIREQICPAQPTSQGTAVEAAMEEETSERPAGATESPVATPRELAMEAVRAGHVEEAFDILSREATQERSGRARFQRRIELAGLCMSSGHESIAYPILQELAEEIERRKLDEWEAPNVVAYPLTLLFRCLSKLDGDAHERQRIYGLICRLDPVQALGCSK